VVIPWRPQPDRVANYEYVCDWFRRHLPDADLIPVDTPHVPFNAAACRNEGVRQAGHTDVVVISDADVIPDPDALNAAIRAAGDGRIHMPYTTFKSLDKDTPRLVVEGGTHTPQSTKSATGGTYVATPAGWWAAGGMDDRFRGWGCE